MEGRSPGAEQTMKATQAGRIGRHGLPTSRKQVQELQKSLHAKAKAEPSYRFYSLWDKVCRMDVLEEAYRRCRSNGGAAGTDRESFESIEARGAETWLGNLQEELRLKTYEPRPLLRVWIPKSNGGRRPLSIPSIRDRVAQMAVLQVIGPIFEADLLPQQYGFRPKLDAKMALRRAYFHITEHGRRDVVDADLKDYFGQIPHESMMKCVARRIADGAILGVLKQWLRVSVEERTPHGVRRTAEAKRNKRGAAQGSIVSPLLANLYFRRFVLAWYQHGHAARLDAHIVNYADDMVICCRPGDGEKAMYIMRQLIERIGLTVNEDKTRLARLPSHGFDFLGYTVGISYGKSGRPYIGTKPSKKAVKRVLERIREETSRRWGQRSVEDCVKKLNQVTRGWCGYFNQGPVLEEYKQLRAYQERRLRKWLMRKHKRRGTGYRQYPDEYLYGTLGLFKPPTRRADLLSAKA